jgi:hypothetical protein
MTRILLLSPSTKPRLEQVRRVEPLVGGEQGLQARRASIKSEASGLQRGSSGSRAPGERGVVTEVYFKISWGEAQLAKTSLLLAMI